MIDILNLTYPELEAFMEPLGEKRFRTAQLWKWLWDRGSCDFGAMTDIAKELRERLGAEAKITWPTVETTLESQDGTVKFLLVLEDGARVETVLIPEKTHFTLCLSTQVGCALGCHFCATGRMGFSRNMSMAEILGQVLTARKFLAERESKKALRNLVFMGMGEPLLNVAELIRSLETLRHPLGLNFSSRRMTVSTVGLPKGLEVLGKSGLASLAISLHAPTQELRERIMPGAAKVPLFKLMEALKRYPLKPRQRLTFEYILLKGVNDSEEHARQLVRLLSHVKAKVNLIACNPGADTGFEPPSPKRILAFERVLWDKDMTVVLRKSKGSDIAAACGQLAGRVGQD